MCIPQCLCWWWIGRAGGCCWWSQARWWRSAWRASPPTSPWGRPCRVRTSYLMLIIIVFCILCRRPALAAPGPGDRSICGILCRVCNNTFLHHGRAAAAEVILGTVMEMVHKSGIAWIRLNTAKLIWAKLVSEMELSIIIDHIFCLLWKFLTHLRQLTW